MARGDVLTSGEASANVLPPLVGSENLECASFGQCSTADGNEFCFSRRKPADVAEGSQQSARLTHTSSLNRELGAPDRARR